MQQDNNYMDKKLKQLENQSLPDLSKMDEHWDDLKRSLLPESSLPKSKPGNKIFRWVIAASLAGIAFFVAYKFILKNNDDPTGIPVWQKSDIAPAADTLPTIRFTPGKEATTVIGKDTVVFKPREEKTYSDTILLTGKTTDGKEIKLIGTNTNGKKYKNTISFKAPKEKIRQLPTLLKAKTTDGKEVEIFVTPVNDTTNKKPDVDKKKILQDFFASLEKESQSFVINNKKDTVIWGKDGTALFIPANSFNGNHAVTITMKEYYSYQDIITNRLTTCADDKLLITGGMLHLKATINGKEVNIEPGKSIRWFAPDTTASEMKQMQLFNGVVNNGSLNIRTNENADTVAADVDFSPDNINWVLQPGSFTGNYFYTSVRVLDLRDEPYRIRETRKGRVGNFYISPEAQISKEELKNYLISKKGYKKVTFRKQEEGYKKRWGLSIWRGYSGKYIIDLGDSTWMDINVAKRHNLKAKDTIVSRNRVRGWYEFEVYDRKGKSEFKFDTALSKDNLNNLADRYSIDIRKLGWVNCDRFYRDNRPKIDYIVQLNEPASDYCTLLVFENMKSMMSGSIEGKKIIFRNVPEGEPVKVFSIGVSGGKPVAAIQDVQLSRKPLRDLKFEQTTPADIRERAAGLDKP